jgi:hypothetical protein
MVETAAPFMETKNSVIFTIGLDLIPSGLAMHFVSGESIRIAEPHPQLGDFIQLQGSHKQTVYVLICRLTWDSDVDLPMLRMASMQLSIELELSEGLIAIPRLGVGYGHEWQTIKDILERELLGETFLVRLHDTPERGNISHRICKVTNSCFIVQKTDILNGTLPIVIDIASDGLTSGLRETIKQRHDGMGMHDTKIYKKGAMYQILPTPNFSRHVFYVVNRHKNSDPPCLESYRQALTKVRVVCHRDKIKSLSTLRLPFEREGISAKEVRDTILRVFEDSGIHLVLSVGNA